MSDTEEPGTFKLDNTGDFLNFTVYNKMTDEIQTVIYQYRIPEIITNYNDIAEFNRKVIGSAWEDPLNDVDVTVLCRKRQVQRNCALGATAAMRTVQ